MTSRTHPPRRSTARVSALLIGILVGAVAGCSTLPRYVEPQLPREQLATLEAAGAWPLYVLFIVSVDGQDPGLLSKRVTLLPGTHRVEVRYEQLGGVFGHPISLTLAAEAGRTYRAEGTITRRPTDVTAGAWAAWIVDTGTNQVVSGQRP